MKFTVEQKQIGSIEITQKESTPINITPAKGMNFELNIGTPGPSAIADLQPIEDAIDALENRTASVEQRTTSVELAVDSLDERQTATEADVAAHALRIAQAEATLTAHDLRLIALETAEPPVSDFSAPYYAQALQQLSKNDLAVIDKPNTVLVMPPSPEAGDKVGVYALDATGQIQSIRLNGQTGVFEIDETQILCVFRFVDNAIGWILC